MIQNDMVVTGVHVFFGLKFLRDAGTKSSVKLGQNFVMVCLDFSWPVGLFADKEVQTPGLHLPSHALIPYLKRTTSAPYFNQVRNCITIVLLHRSKSLQKLIYTISDDVF